MIRMFLFLRVECARLDTDLEQWALCTAWVSVLMDCGARGRAVLGDPVNLQSNCLNFYFYFIYFFQNRSFCVALALLKVAL